MTRLKTIGPFRIGRVLHLLPRSCRKDQFRLQGKTVDIFLEIVVERSFSSRLEAIFIRKIPMEIIAARVNLQDTDPEGCNTRLINL